MASILLSYVDSDKAAAKTLAKVLEDAHHTVYSADPTGPDLRPGKRVHCIIAVWSAAAAASPHVYEDARVALKRGMLVQVFTSDFDPSILAPVFREKPLISIEDGEQILRIVVDVVRLVVASLNMPTTLMAIAGRRSSDEPISEELAQLRKDFEHAQARRKAALEKHAGQLAYQVPKTMRRGAAETVEVRLGLAHRKMTVGFTGSGDVTIEDLPIVETMTVNLYGSPGAFQITPQSRETQFVMGSLIGASLDHDRFGRWLWDVRPNRIGTHTLNVVVSADMRDSRGVSTSESNPDRMFSVTVRVNFGSASVRVLKWATAGAVTGLAGAYTHHVWWPKVKVLLSDVGWLS